MRFWGMNMLKKVLMITTLVGLSTLAFADQMTLSKAPITLDGNATLTSDYRFRGVTQTNNDPAVQAGFTLAHESGLYVGAWGSNVGFASSLELDPYIGYSTALPILGQPTLDIGAWYYAYPSSSDSNWVEYSAKLTFPTVFMQDDRLFTSINYANDYLGDDAKGDQWYFNAVYSLPIPASNFDINAGLGYTKTSDYVFGSGDSKDYLDWKLGVSYNVQAFDGVSAELAAIGSNIDTDDYSSAEKRAVRTGAVFTLNKTF